MGKRWVDGKWERQIKWCPYCRAEHEWQGRACEASMGWRHANTAEMAQEWDINAAWGGIVRSIDRADAARRNRLLYSVNCPDCRTPYQSYSQRGETCGACSSAESEGR